MQPVVFVLRHFSSNTDKYAVNLQRCSLSPVEERVRLFMFAETKAQFWTSGLLHAQSEPVLNLQSQSTATGSCQIPRALCSLEKIKHSDRMMCKWEQQGCFPGLGLFVLLALLLLIIQTFNVYVIRKPRLKKKIKVKKKKRWLRSFSFLRVNLSLRQIVDHSPQHRDFAVRLK